MKSPAIHTATRRMARDMQSTLCQVNDNWFPARPESSGGLRQRLHAAWLVLTGRADALKWVGQ